MDQDHIKSLRYLFEIACRTKSIADQKSTLLRIIDIEVRESSPNLIQDYKKLLKIYGTVWI